MDEQVEGLRRYAFENRPRGYEILVWQTENSTKDYVDYQVKRGMEHILGNYVKRSCRGRSVGKRLIKKALKDFNRIECHKARLEILACNLGAMNFYKRLAFCWEGYLHKDEEKKDVIIMSKTLP